MNYRHIFHAGNLCDVVKHTVLILLLRKLRAKEKGFTVLDTHAGVGLYDLHDERAGKTQEAESGILRFLQAPRLPALDDFYNIIAKLNPDGETRFYPGSPHLTQAMLREQDRLIACELHPEDARELKRNLRNDKRVSVHLRDGYEAMTALMPPDPKRGLTLIDPPYEIVDEYEKLTAAVASLHKRWPTGTIAIWYPIKDRPALWKWHESLIALGIPKILCAEFIFAPEARADHLNGSGMIFVNPPFELDAELETLFPALHQALQTDYQNNQIKWLTPA